MAHGTPLRRNPWEGRLGPGRAWTQAWLPLDSAESHPGDVEPEPDPEHGPNAEPASESGAERDGGHEGECARIRVRKGPVELAGWVAEGDPAAEDPWRTDPQSQSPPGRAQSG